MADREKKSVVTRKHLARVEREQIQRRYITISSIVVVILIVGVIAVGIVNELIIKPRQPIVDIGNTTITTDEFQTFIRFQRFRLVNEYLSTYQFIENLGDPNSFSYFESYLVQLQSELQPEILGLNSIDELIDDYIVRQEAQKLGITVSKDEVQKRVNEVMFQYFPDGTPTPQPTNVDFQTPTLSAIQMTLIPPTPTLVITDTEDVLIGLTPTIEEADTGVEPSPTAIPPTPTLYAEEAFSNDYDDFMSYIKSFAKVSEKSIFDFYESIILRERVGEAVVAQPPTKEEKLWARHILFRNEEAGDSQALDFLARIEAGEDFNTIAEELTSTDAEENSDIVYEDLGWFGSGDMVEPFEEGAKGLKVGEVSQPVQTSFGWHVIQLLGRDVQPLTQSEMDQLRFEGFQLWLDTKQAELDININPDWISMVPLEPDIPEQIKVELPE